jgi:Flp pilus assembly protein TadG
VIRRRRRGRGEEGSVTLEVAVLTPTLLSIIVFAILVGRVETAHGSVDQAAADAARQASISLTAGQAQQSAYQAAEQTLASEGLQCSSLSVDVNTDGFNVPVGQSATVTATVTCVVALSDITGIIPIGHHSETSVMISPLDTYRER